MPKGMHIILPTRSKAMFRHLLTVVALLTFICSVLSPVMGITSPIIQRSGKPLLISIFLPWLYLLYLLA